MNSFVSATNKMAGWLTYLLCSSFLLLASAGWAQAPDWQSVTAINDTNGVLVATDPSGNVYVAGIFFGTVNFGSTQLTSAGNADIYVAKWSPLTRTYVWVQQAGGRNSEFVSAIIATGSGLYIAGGFYAYANPTPITTTIGTTTLTNPYGITTDGFVAKLTDAGASGSFTWAQRLGGTGDDGIVALAAAGNSIYAAGSFTSTATFGSTTLTSAGGKDAFLTKFSDAGATSTVGWTQPLGGIYDEVATAVATTGQAVYVAGTFASPTLACGSMVLTNALASSSDLFVTKLTDVGATPSYNWAQRAGSIGDEQLTTLAVSGSNVYIGGNYYGFALPIGTTTLPNAGMYDFFVAKLTDAGNTSSFTWAQQVGGYYNDELMAMVAVGTTLYLTGEYGSDPVAFGPTTLPNVSRLAGYTDVFVARLTDKGPTCSFTWAQRAGGAGIDEVENLALSSGKLYIAGFAAPPCQFGSITLGTPPYSNSYDIYLATLSDNSALASTAAKAPIQLLLYPNPAHTSTTVQLPALAGVEQVTLTLQDALGQIVRTTTVALPATGLTQPVAVAGLRSGLYVLRVQAGSAIASSRLVVE